MIRSDQWFGYLTVKEMVDRWFVNSTSFGEQKAPWEMNDKLYKVVMVPYRIANTDY
jgi:hypothetical protein